MGSTAAIRRRQIEVADAPEGLGFARDWVSAKLTHQREFLEELWHRRPEGDGLFQGPVGTLKDCLGQVRALTGTLDAQRATLMGLEGGAGRAYFQCLGQLVPENFRFEGRSRQPATDAFNAVLNYSYGILYSLIEKACILAGLDPFVGFLHTDNYNKKSLVYDLIEPFRILGDRTTVLLFTGRRAQQDYFEPVAGGIALSQAGRAFFISEFNERLDKTIRYPIQGKPGKTRNVKQRDILRHEAHALANALLGKRDLPIVVETRKLWDDDTATVAPDADDDPTAPDDPEKPPY